MKSTLFEKVRSAFKPSTNQFNQAVPQWYKCNFNRNQAENFLADTDIGTFVMRKSETIQDCLCLSVKVPKYINVTEISHYLIVQSKSTRNHNTYSVRGYSKEFSDLDSLVTHCSVMRDILPVTLNLDFYREKSNHYENKRNDFFYYSSSSSSLTSTESNDWDSNSISSMC